MNTKRKAAKRKPLKWPDKAVKRPNNSRRWKAGRYTIGEIPFTYGTFYHCYVNDRTTRFAREDTLEAAKEACQEHYEAKGAP